MKKGFTLTELLVVMAILIAITASSVVSYTRMTKNMKEREYNRIVEEFEAAAEVYVASNYGLREKIYSGDGYAVVTLKVLDKEGLIDLYKQTDPVTGQTFDGSNYVNIYLDENSNIFAQFMSEANYVFANSRSKQTILAGTNYGRVQMLEYIIGYARGQYDSTTGTYQTQNINLDEVNISVMDVTNPSSPVSVNGVITTEAGVDHTFEVTYRYHFPDGDRQLQRTVIVYNQAPELKSISLQPDNTVTGLSADQVLLIATAQSLHDDLYFHFKVNGIDNINETGTFLLTENATVEVWVEDSYGGKSESLTKTVSYINHGVTEPDPGTDPGTEPTPDPGTTEPTNDPDPNETPSSGGEGV